MKRIKYMYSLQRSKKQKSRQKQQHQSKNPKSQYLKTLKTEAMKNLYNFQHNNFIKTQLNITTRNTQQFFSTQYKSRSSQQKDNFRKTMTSKLTNETKTLQNKKKLSTYETANLNIRKLLRAKTQSQGQQNNKLLRNPFYKIQKLREMEKKMSLNVNKQLIGLNEQILHQIQQPKSNNSLHLKTQSQTSDNLFVSRSKKQWYFASKKNKFRTIQQDQTQSSIEVSERSKINSTIIQSIITNTPQVIKSINSHSHKGSSLSGCQLAQILQFNKFDSIMHDSDNVIVEQSRQQSPARIRDKSLTVKYNEIKDYFQKKYQYKNVINQDYLQVENFDNNE